MCWCPLWDADLPYEEDKGSVLCSLYSFLSFFSFIVALDITCILECLSLPSAKILPFSAKCQNILSFSDINKVKKTSAV